MHYYKRHIGDYIKDASHLTLLEHGAYVRLMDVYYSRESPLPADESELFRLLSVRDRRESSAIHAVLKEFWNLTPEGWIQSRCDREIGKARQKAEANRENGKHGGRPSKTKPNAKVVNNPDGYKNKTNSVVVGINPETETKPYPTTSVTITSESDYPTTQSGARGKATGSRDTGSDRERWLRIENKYPRGTWEPKALLLAERESCRRADEGFSWDELEAGVDRMAAQKRAMGKIGTQFIPSPAKFFAPDPDMPNSYPFQGEFKLPATKAQAAQDENIAASLRWLAASGDAP